MGFTVWTTVWMALNSLKAKELAERVGFETAVQRNSNDLARHGRHSTAANALQSHQWIAHGSRRK
jgi:hypothetical protein